MQSYPELLAFSFFSWIFEYFLSENVFFRKVCQNLGRYAKLKPFGFYSVKAELKLHFKFKSYDHFVKPINFLDFYWYQQRRVYGIWNFLSCLFSLPSFIIMTFLKLGLKGEEAIWSIPGRSKGLPTKESVKWC